MTLSKKLFGVMAMIAALGTVLVSAQLSSATHVRPKGATPLYVPLVVAYKQCVGGASQHGAPLSFASCVSPVQESRGHMVRVRDGLTAQVEVDRMTAEVTDSSTEPPNKPQISKHLRSLQATILRKHCSRS